jgi:membrane protease YdiL (CAAX protease family)
VEDEVRPSWQKLIHLNWKFGLGLLLVVCIPRFMLVLAANASGNYSSIGAIMVISALCPFVFLTPFGRRKIGVTKPNRYSQLLVAFVAGIAFSGLLYAIGRILYATSFENWYVYIGKSYKIPAGISQPDRASLFTIVAITGMLFSPIGEELFFRGIVHTSFACSIGEKRASLVDSSAFALTHLSHFGLVFIDQQWRFLVMPAFLWVMSMFLVSRLFFWFKTASGSLLGAILCHAGFNLGMTYCIFYLLS